MAQKSRAFLALTKASFRMYFRNKGALVFTLLIPIALLSIFGFLSKGRSHAVSIALTNHANSEIAAKFVSEIKNISAFSVEEMPEVDGLSKLGKGDVDLQIVIPENFGKRKDDKPVESTIQTFFNTARAQSGQIGNLAIVQIVSKLDKQITNAPTFLSVKSEGITTSELGYFDFILPGILAMSVMQLGIFGVAFSFVAMKASGALRRIQATPVHPVYFVFAQATVRLIVTLLTATILVSFGIYFFDFHMVGNYFTFGLVCILGILIFLGIGFSIAGWARDETQVAPIANLIQLPMLMLSGIFFPRDAFPSWLKTITDYFPLTYFSHALRKVANDGASIIDLPVDMIGMAVWLIVIYTFAVRVFRWE